MCLWNLPRIGIQTFVLAATICFATTKATAQIVLPLSENGEFASNLDGWNATSGGASILDANTGFGKAQLVGATGLWQYVPVSGLSDYQLVNCKAYKTLLSPAAGVSPGWAGIGITYYDAQWGVIDTFEKQINVSSGPDDFGLPKLVPCSLGVRVPPNAVHSIFWVANDPANSKTVVDSLYLLDYFPGQNTSEFFGPKLHMYPQFISDVYGKLHQTSGLEFWDIQGFIDIGNGSMGNAGSPCSISQEVRLTAGATYKLDWFNFPSFTPSIPTTNVGVDFFDANWNRLGGTYKTTGYAFQYLSDNQQIDVPQGTVHSILWVWMDSLTANDGSQQLPYLAFELSQVESVAPTIAFAKQPSNLGPNDRGLKIFLTYTDNLRGFPNIDSNLMSLVGPSGKRFLLYNTDITNSDDPLKTRITLTGTEGGGELDWSVQEPGTYTVTIPADSIRDAAGNPASAGLTATFQVTLN